MPKTIPRIGRHEFLRGLKLLVQMVGYTDQLTEADLREMMEEENRRSEKQPFKSVEDWLHFAFDHYGTSMEILHHEDDEGYVTLTEDGEKLLNAENFEEEAFHLLERKSVDNFTYFYRTVKALDEKVQTGKYGLGSNLGSEINTLMTDTGKGNSVTAGTIKGILRDFGIVKKEDGEWRINPSKYSDLRGKDKDLVLELIREKGNEMPLAELENQLLMTFDWDSNRINEVLKELEGSRTRTWQHSGEQYVQVIE